TFAEQGADAGALADRLYRRQETFAAAEAQVLRFKLGQQSALAAFHRPGEGAAGADGIETIKMAQARGFQDTGGIADAAERPEGEQALVFHALFTVARFEQPLATDGAGRAAMPAAEMILGQVLAAQMLR